MDDWNDKRLFNALRRGDTEALSILFLRHYDYLMHYGMRMGANQTLVEGCVQELFIHLLETSEKYSKVNLVRAYLFKSLRHRILAAIKKERRMKSVNEQSQNPLNMQFCIEDLMIREEVRKEARGILSFALNRLPARQKEAIYLRYYGGLSTQEIAEIMGTAAQTILNTLYQALQKLRSSKDIRSIRNL